MNKFPVPYEFNITRDGRVLVKTSQVKLVDKKLKIVSTEKPLFEDSEGFLMVDLFKSKKYRQYVHRLVAEKYLDNPNNYEHVLFKDGNVKNPSVDNLEWCP